MKGARPLTGDEVTAIKSAFTGKMAKRNLALFTLGVNTGFRVSEILSLTLGDVLSRDGQIEPRISVHRRNMKGKKASRSVALNIYAKNGITPWLHELDQRGWCHRDDFVFQSMQRGNKPISRRMAHRVLIDAYKRAGVTGKLGTHTMRKTFANNIYQFYVRAGGAVDAVRATSKAMGHDDIKTTEKYLSFRTDLIDEAIDAVGV